MANTERTLLVRNLGKRSYEPVWQAMKAFTHQRNEHAQDEIWLVQHDPVFTQGQAGKPEHVLLPGNIPVVQVDRGGQVTYHGPGQLVVYFLINVRRMDSGPRSLVSALENAVISLLASYGIESANKPDAPGVYVGEAKIAALGLRFRKGCSYHGLSLNVDMDLEPFHRINPCGYAGLAVTQLTDLIEDVDFNLVGKQLVQCLITELGYNGAELVIDTDVPYGEILSPTGS
ncbi:octanoyltransferase [Endozoicomonas sp. (ex Bugula neritina AB1)]|nr:octanoyltransferase [Endozoicomonas sp. (ex Bugula neritina AB1)]